MATSGNIEKKFHGGSTGGYYIGIDWKVNSQSVSGNSSNVTATFYIRTSGNGYTISSSASKNVTLTINGTKYSGTATVGMGANTKKNLLSKTVTVNHNSDGTKTCSFACSGVFGLTLSGKYYGTVSHSGNGTFNTINLNSAPRWTSDDTRMNDIRGHVIIPENWNSVTVTSATATDNEQGGNLHYDIHRYINGVYSAQIKAGGSNLSVTDNIGSWGQGTRIKYEAKVHDGSLWASGSRWSWEYTKNTFTKASVNNVDTIYSDSNTFSFTLYGLRNSGANNGYVNAEFGYRIESLIPGISVYGESWTFVEGQNDMRVTLGIKKGSNPTNRNWLDINELKAKFRNNNYMGTVRLRLVSWNSYGSEGYTDFDVYVDLRQNPPYTKIRYGANNKINFNGTDYYIPAHLPFYLEWDAVSDPVEGNACTYDVLYQIGEESWVHLGSTSSTNYTAYLGNTAIGNRKINNFRMIVRAKTRYGYYSDTGATRISLWDYSLPTVRVSSINRTKDKVTISGQITTNTSIPGNTASDEHYRWHGESNIGFKASGSGATKPFTLNIAAAQNKSGNIHIASSDLVMDKLSAIISKQWGNIDVAVKAYMPIMSMNKFGVGIGTRLANSNYVFEVDGNANIKGNLHINGKPIQMDTSNLLKKSDLATATNYKGKVANIGNNGVMEVGKYIDFHNHTTNDYDSRITCDGDILTVSRHLATGGNLTVGGTINPQSYIQLPNSGGSWLNGATNGNIRGYRQSTGSYHPLISQTTSSGHKVSLGGLGDYFGFYLYDANRTANGFDKEFTFSLANKELYTTCRTIHNEWVYCQGNYGLYFQTHNGGWYMSDSSWVRSYADKSIYTGGTIKAGNALETRYINSTGGNLDINSRGNTLFINANAASGANLNINRQWSGSQGTEVSIYNNKGKGWGYLGSSEYSFYRVYGIGGSVSARESKYEISKADTETQYDNVKALNIYNYRSISDERDEEGNVVKEHKREDLLLGCMVDELPTEVTFYDNEGGDGKAVDMYSYTTMVAGATKHLINKVETLEKENKIKDNKISELEQRLEKMEELLNGIINKG